MKTPRFVLDSFYKILRKRKAVCERRPFSLPALALTVAAALWLTACSGQPSGWAGTEASGGDTAATGTSGTVASPAPYVVFHPSEGSDSATLHVEVARTNQEKARGLMFRDRLGADDGMIFIWNKPVTEAFWMKDTPLPLSIAFINGSGTIVDIQDMQPQTLDAHEPAAPYVFAVEANQGWFSQHGVKRGDSGEFIEK